jgi:hypothetical protein
MLSDKGFMNRKIIRNINNKYGCITYLLFLIIKTTIDRINRVDKIIQEPRLKYILKLECFNIEIPQM